jgi:SAM-dependent methyltransferase
MSIRHRRKQRAKDRLGTIYDGLGRQAVHPFPARMAPSVALEALGKTRQSLRVLDPMMGSGTVIALARSRGHQAIGVDIDPLAVLISRVWTTPINTMKVRTQARQVLNRARAKGSSIPIRDAYPPHANDETRRFIRYWFDGYTRRQLTALSMAIRRVHDAAIRDVLWCSFSRLIITKQAGASLAIDLSHSRPHRYFRYAPSKPFRNFLSAVERVSENCIRKTSSRRGPTPRLLKADARALPIPDSSIDLLLTSPPYLNAIDYLRCSKFSLVWMGYDVDKLRELRAKSIGTEVGDWELERQSDVEKILNRLKLKPKLSSANKAILARYIGDMRKSFGEAARVIRRGGKAIYVIGENTLSGTYVRNSLILSSIAESSGFKLITSRKRTLPANRRYLPPPETRSNGAALATRMRREVVLAFKRV